MIENLETLVRLASTGTMMETATQLEISQSAVSKRIAALERYYDKTLIERDGRRVTLTQNGQQLVDKVAPLLLEVRSAFLEDNALSKGRIIVGVSEAILASWGPQLFAIVQTELPEVEFEFHAQRSPVVLDRIRAGEYMVGVCTGVADAEVEAANLQQALELAREKLEEANEKNEFLTAELDDAQADASRAREELASKVRLLESNLRQSKNESVANRLEAKGLRKELENARNSLDVTVSKADQLSTENKAMQQNISSLTLEMDAKASISSEADARQKELEAVRKSLHEAVADKDELAVAYELLQKEVSSIAADRDRLLAERASPSPKAGANLSSSFEVEALQSELEGMRRSLEEANAYKEQLSTFKDGMLKKINKLTKERDQLLAERESMQQQIDRVADTQVAAAGLVA